MQAPILFHSQRQHCFELLHIFCSSPRGLGLERIPPQGLPVDDQADNIEEEGCAFKNTQYGNEERGIYSKPLLMVAAHVYMHTLESIHLW